MNRGLVAACVAFALGCAQCGHVTIPVAPPRTAPMSERAAYFQQYRTRTRVRFIDHRAVVDLPFTGALELGNGLYVRHPGDLLPAVEPTSRTAEIARAIAARERTSNAVTAAGYGSVAAGGLIVLLGFALTQRADTAITGVGVGTAVIGLGLLFSGQVAFSTTREEEQECFERYDEALQERLGIAVRRVQTPATTPSAPVAP